MSELRPSPIADSTPVEDLCPIDVVHETNTGQPCLRGSRCPACQQLAFPPREMCDQCYHRPQEDVSLGSEGSLYAFSTVHVSSSHEVPYTLGFVDLSSDIRVLARLVGPTGTFAIGDPVVLTVQSGSGWAFAKKGAERAVSHG